MYEDACTGYSYSLDTVIGCRSMWNTLHRVISFHKKENPSFQKAYAGCITNRSCTYVGCCIDRACTYRCCRTTGRVPVVFVWYMLSSSTDWLSGSSTGWLQVSGTGWYSFTVVYLIVIVWHWFHDSTSTLGRLDKARIGGCSHLLVVAREHRGLWPPSGWSQRIGQLEFPSGCSLRN